MSFILKISRCIDRFSEWIGEVMLWFIFASVLLSAGNALARKLLRIGSNAFIEMQWYLFGAVFLLGAGYAFLKNAHVRIDFVSSRLSARMRAWIDVAGIIVFLTPLCLLLMRLSWPLFVNAWQSGEMSQSAGGLIRWPVYLLLPLGVLLLMVQGFSEIVKRVAFLKGMIPDPLAYKTADSKSAEPSPDKNRSGES